MSFCIYIARSNYRFKKVAFTYNRLMTANSNQDLIFIQRALKQHILSKTTKIIVDRIPNSINEK